MHDCGQWDTGSMTEFLPTLWLLHHNNEASRLTSLHYNGCTHVAVYNAYVKVWFGEFPV